MVGLTLVLSLFRWIQNRQDTNRGVFKGVAILEKAIKGFRDRWLQVKLYKGISSLNAESS